VALVQQLASIWEPILVALLALLLILGIIFKVPGKILAGWKLWKEKPSGKATLPTETIRAVLEHVGSYMGPEWGHATRTKTQEKGMDAHARWTFTNITKGPIKIVDAYLDLRPPVHGIVWVRHHKSDMHGDYFLMPGLPVPGSTDFTMFPPIRKPGQDLKATVVLVDNLGNEHRAKVVFRAPKD